MISSLTVATTADDGGRDPLVAANADVPPSAITPRGHAQATNAANLEMKEWILHVICSTLSAAFFKLPSERIYKVTTDPEPIKQDRDFCPVFLVKLQVPWLSCTRRFDVRLRNIL
jgi:hypothetical protein